MSEGKRGGPGPAPLPALRRGVDLELLAPLLCLAGLVISVYLGVMHYAVHLGRLSLGEVCGAAADCNSVVASRYGMLLGVPLPVWGACYYVVAGALAFAILLLRREDAPAFAGALIALTAAALALDAYLAWAMAVRLRTPCPLCIATYAVNLLILLCALRAAVRHRGLPKRLGSLLPSPAILASPLDPAYYREALKLALVAAGAGGSLMLLVLNLLVSRSLARGEKAELANLLEYMASAPPTAIATEGLPARGPEGAPITIVAFSDFLCEQCRLASRYLAIVAANHRDSLRIFYASYPGDQECNPVADRTLHPGACAVALAAECAHRQGRFWEFHDAVFGDPGKAGAEKIAAYAARAGMDTTGLGACRSDPAAAAALRAQIELARAAGVGSTPTLFVNGRGIVGALKPWMLEAAIRSVAPSPGVPGK
ncbi:MAG TPA: vitamin K epoxide reductase family protein [Candidatus Eisenbacteria bacterium]|jgi:protein-disulfide isomerase/uncharacterized membrane protein